MINEKTQLGKVVSLLKGLERHFYAEDEKSIFYLKQCKALGLYTRKGDEVWKIEIRPQRKSRVLTLLGAKQPYQAASFQLSW